VVLSEHQPFFPANTIFTDFAQVVGIKPVALILPLVTAQPRQQVAWATRDH
jgi:hypothetical protein